MHSLRALCAIYLLPGNFFPSPLKSTKTARCDNKENRKSYRVLNITRNLRTHFAILELISANIVVFLIETPKFERQALPLD